MFKFGSETVIVVVKGNKVLFGNTNDGARLAPIQGLKLSYVGAVREHPDLEVRDDWREETIKRFEKKCKSYKTESEVGNYIIEDLRKHGYLPLMKQKKGFRPEVIK